MHTCSASTGCSSCCFDSAAGVVSVADAIALSVAAEHCLCTQMLYVTSHLAQWQRQYYVSAVSCHPRARASRSRRRQTGLQTLAGERGSKHAFGQCLVPPLCRCMMWVTVLMSQRQLGQSGIAQIQRVRPLTLLWWQLRLLAHYRSQAVDALVASVILAARSAVGKRSQPSVQICITEPAVKSQAAEGSASLANTSVIVR